MRTDLPSKIVKVLSSSLKFSPRYGLTVAGADEMNPSFPATYGTLLRQLLVGLALRICIRFAAYPRNFLALHSYQALAAVELRLKGTLD